MTAQQPMDSASGAHGTVAGLDLTGRLAVVTGGSSGLAAGDHTRPEGRGRAAWCASAD
ncbi:hypothetical protein ACWGLF_28795 [Streptomyces puniciscabiei]